jgi:hypothetical protein
MPGGHAHAVDPLLPAIGDLTCVYPRWCGLGFALAFLQTHRFLIGDRQRRPQRLTASVRAVLSGNSRDRNRTRQF